MTAPAVQPALGAAAVWREVEARQIAIRSVSATGSTPLSATRPSARCGYCNVARNRLAGTWKRLATRSPNSVR